MYIQCIQWSEFEHVHGLVILSLQEIKEINIYNLQCSLDSFCFEMY